MAFIAWIFKNFGVFFGGLFLLYLFLIIRRLTQLYDLFRGVPGQDAAHTTPVRLPPALECLDPLLDRLTAAAGSGVDTSPLIDAIWSEVDSRVSVHFTALNGYINTLILIGFAGTIFGAIGAFNEMFTGLGDGREAAEVFRQSWENGLATALYTSLGAAGIGGFMITLICSRFFMTRAKQLEVIVSLAISQIIEETQPWVHDDAQVGGSKWSKSRTPEKTSLPISSS